MRVAFFAHYAGLYGANQSLLAMLLGFRSLGVEPLILLPENGPFADRLDAENIPFKIFDFELWMSPRRKYWRAPLRILRNRRVLPSLVEEISRFGAELIHTNTSVLGIGAIVAQKMDIPHIWHIREFAELTFGMRFDLGRTHSQRILNESAAIITISHILKKRLIPPDIKERCSVIYNGIMPRRAMESLYIKKKEMTENPDFTFLMVGRVSPKKGQEQAIRALSILGQTSKLNIVGSGPEKYMRKLTKRCQELGLEKNVCFTGFLPNPMTAYLKADAVLVCSKYEGMGRVTAEAMALGLPVIGLNSTGTAELITHRKTGLLYDDSVPELAARMDELISSNQLRSLIGENGHKKAVSHFTVERCCQAVYNVYQSISPPMNVSRPTI